MYVLWGGGLVVRLTPKIPGQYLKTVDWRADQGEVENQTDGRRWKQGFWWTDDKHQPDERNNQRWGIAQEDLNCKFCKGGKSSKCKHSHQNSLFILTFGFPRINSNRIVKGKNRNK